MIRKIRAYIQEQHMLEQGDRVTVGVSGGADSVCLLLCLLSLQEEWKLELQAVHVHHGLRGEEADRDQAFVEELCRSHKIPCLVRRVDVRRIAAEEGLSVEEAGRIIRYRIFREVAAGGKIAVAHHRDDQSETVLHHLIRGTGLKGLAGMAPVSGSVVRPLLIVSRREIEEYLVACGQDYQVDATNQENVYTRNKIRNQLLPWMEEELNPQVGEHLAQLAEQAREVDLYLDREAEKWMEQSEVLKDAAEDGLQAMHLPVEALAALGPAVGKRVILRALEQAGGSRKDLGAVHLNGAWALLSKSVGSSLDLPDGWVAEREYSHLRVGRRSQSISKTGLPTMRTRVFSREKEEKIPEKSYTKWFDYDKIKCNAVLRFRETGDYLELAGVGRKTVKSYMIDRKIPAKDRDQIPVLADGKHVIWIIGHRISEAYKITPDTKRVWEVTVDFEEMASMEQDT